MKEINSQNIKKTYDVRVGPKFNTRASVQVNSR